MAYDYVNFSCIPQLTYGTPGVYATLSDCENAVNDGITKPVLILNPLWSASKKVLPSLAISKLGDGYQQIIFQGLDQINEEWSITSPVLLGSQVDELLSQLRAFCVRSFLWSPNNGAIPYQEFTCEQWTRTKLGVNTSQIRGIFKMTILGSGLLIGGVQTQIIDTSNNAVLRLTGNGANNANNFRDFYGGAITRDGSPAYSTQQSRWNGSSILLNGSSTIELPAINFSNENLTFEAWVYFTQFSFGASVQAILGNAQGDAGGNAGLFLGIQNFGSQDNRFIFRHWLNDNTNANHPESVQLNTWYHVAGVKSGTTLDIFVNGAKGSSGSTTQATASNPFTIGGAKNPSSFANNFVGHIDDILITRSAAKYSNNFTPPTQETTLATDLYQANNVLLLDFSDINGSTFFYDYCGKAITPNGTTQLSTTQRKFGNSSLFLNNSGFIQIVTTTNDFYFDADFTCEGWFYVTSVGGSGSNFFYLGTSEGGGRTQLGLNSAGRLWVESFGVGVLTLSSSAFPLNQWNHVAFVRKNTTLTIFLNGISVASTNYSGVLGMTGGIVLGGTSNSNRYAGYMDEIRITKGVARYAVNFTPDNYPSILERDTNIDKVVFLTHFNGVNNQTTFSELTNKPITRFGNAVISTSSSKFNGSSLFLPQAGTTDYLEVSSSDFNFGSSDFTIECWVMTTRGSTPQSIIHKVNTDGSLGSGYHLYFSDFTNLVFVTSAFTLSWGAILNSNQWYHVAVTRQGNVFRLFANGVQRDTTTNSYSFPDLNTPVCIGKNIPSFNTFRGYIDEMRITRLARYAANFTPPTRPFAEI